MGYYSKLVLIIFLVTYINQAIVFLKLSKELGLSNKWLAVIPFIQNILFLRMINENERNVILFLIPVINIVAYVKFYVKFYEVFDISIPWIILSIIIWPIGQVTLFYIGFFKGYVTM